MDKESPVVSIRAKRTKFGTEVLFKSNDFELRSKFNPFVKRKLMRYIGSQTYSINPLGKSPEILDTLSEIIQMKGIELELNDEFIELFTKEMRKLSAKRVKDGHIKYRPDPAMEAILPMWDHQKEGAAFIEATNFRCILRDGPRLGKCYTAIAPILKVGLPIFILCPKELVSVWESEIKKFQSIIEVEVFIQPMDNKKIPDEFEKNPNNGVLIVDETHKLSKRSSARFKRVQKISKNFEKIILISGDDPEDDPKGFFSEVNILYPSFKLSTYKKRYLSAYWIGQIPIYDSFKNNRWKQEMDSFYIRRTESDLGLELVRDLSIKLTPSKSLEDRFKKAIKDLSPIDLHGMRKLQEISAVSKKKVVWDLVKEHKLLEKGRVVIFSNYNSVLKEFAEITKNHALVTKKSLLTGLLEKTDEEIPKLLLINSTQVTEGFALLGLSGVFIIDPTNRASKITQLTRRGSRPGIQGPLVFKVMWDHFFDQSLTQTPSNYSQDRVLKNFQRAVENSME